MKLIIFFSGILMTLFNTAWSAPQIITVGDAADLDCDYSSIQMAIDDQMTDAEIRVSVGTLTSDGVVITNQPVVKLLGGYNNCSEAAAGVSPQERQYTQVSHANGVGLEIDIISDALFGLGDPLNLEISGFAVNNSQGGIWVDYSGGGNLFYLALNDLKVHDNTHRGIGLAGEGLNVAIDDTEIFRNSNLVGGSTQGGGVRCADANVTLHPNTAIYDNESDLGAGVYAIACDLTIHGGGVFNDLSETGIFGNTAADFGGGIYASDSRVSGLGSHDHPLKIHNNSATNPTFGSGAGLYVGTGSSVLLENTFVDHNEAVSRGAGIYVTHFGAGAAPQLLMGSSVNGCSYADICSSLSHNVLSSGFGEGAAIQLRNGPTAFINQSKISDNAAARTSGFFVLGELSSLVMEGNLIFNNGGVDQHQSAEQLFKLIGYENSASVSLNFTTLTNNRVDTVFDVEYEDNQPQNLEVYNSIIYNPNSLIVDPNGGEGEHDANIDCSIVHDLSTAGFEGNGTVVADPVFYGNKNFKLQETSPAIDPDCSDNNSPTYADVIGVARNVGLSADLGAYETTVFDSVIFAHGFESLDH